MAHETILVVDDSIEFVQTVKDCILEPLGYKVIQAVDGQAGLEMSLTHQPALILLDLNLPKMTGFDVLTLLDEYKSQIPVILMTLYGSEAIAVESFRRGVCDYLTKPLSRDQVEQSIRRALTRRPVVQPNKPADPTLVAAETVRQTAVTLSHHINNHLMALTAGLSLMQESLHQETLDYATLSQIIQNGQTSLAQIETVIRVLQRITEVHQVPYCNQIPMIDVEAALREQLQS